MTRGVIHQIMPAFLYADALGNQADRIRAQLRQWGYESQIYTQIRDRRWADPGLDVTQYRSRANQAVIFHYSIGSLLTAQVLNLSERVVPYYHNVTPPEFFRGYNTELARLLDQGQRELELFKRAPYALAASEYNRQEMLARGFARVDVLPYFVTFDELRASAQSPIGREVAQRYVSNRVNVLFVGRLVPNKCQADLVRVLNYYQRLIDPNAGLLLVGGETNAPGYRLELQTLIGVLGVRNVELAGSIGPREGLGGYYQTATVFVCLSEHEGFCVPLLEAMAFDVPVIAFKSTGVPYALGEAGLQLDDKRCDVVSEAIELVHTDRTVRARLIEIQRQRLGDFSHEHVAAHLRTCLQNVRI
ncbi:MAG: glycosyltransferase family 4 protein [Chloroflexi bacterium]|nr:glycosyltransferase family 4 protein [Chloroflexota bacterium]